MTLGCYDPARFIELYSSFAVKTHRVLTAIKQMNRIAVIGLVVLFAATILLDACAAKQQTTASSMPSNLIADGSMPINPPVESQPSPPVAAAPQPNQPAPNSRVIKSEPDSVLEIAPAQLPPAFTPPAADQSAASAAPDAGSAQDYLNENPAGTDPTQSYAGISDYMNQEASYEAMGTGLPMSALLPPPGFYPYYYPYFSRVYFPVYVPAPIAVSRPIPPPVYVGHPAPMPLPPAFLHSSPMRVRFGGGFSGHHH